LRILLLAWLLTGAATAAPPNVVVILADDLGYGDVRALNPASRIPTPHLDALAAAGATFTDAHSPSAVCTPTRYGLLTGRYCWRTRLKSGVLNGYGTPLLAVDRPTLGTLLGARGYVTGCVGKWHLGLGFAKDGDRFDFTAPVSDGPHTHGFEKSFVIPASLDFPPYAYIEDGVLTEAADRTQPHSKFPAFIRQGERSPDFSMVDCLDRLTRAALEFVQASAAGDRPFFLYFPLTAPHKPVLPHPRFIGATELGPYGDFVVQTDAAVGALLDGLERAGVADDTLVIFTSDNGSFMHSRTEGPDHVDDPGTQAYRADRHRSNGPFRGTKADIWEAGHRVPFFVRWPGVVEPGKVQPRTICHVDLYATLAKLIGHTRGDGEAEDSYNFLPLLLDEAAPRRPPVVHHSVNGTFAIRVGNWKLVLSDGSGGREKPKGKPFGEPYTLFELSDDPGETNDLAAKHPDVVKRLTKVLEGIRG